MQYMMAMTFLKGSMVEYSDHSDNSLWAKDPRVDRLRAKIELVEEERFSREYLDVDRRSAANGVKVLLQDGRQLDEKVIEYPLGHALRPKTVGAVQRKFWQNFKKSVFSGGSGENNPIVLECRSIYQGLCG